MNYDDRPTHKPIAPEAPIPGRHWYGGCDPDLPRVDADGVCESCGEKACPECGCGFYPDGGCECKVAVVQPTLVNQMCPTCRGTGGGVYNDCATCGGNGEV